MNLLTKSTFLALLAVVGVILVIGIYQVPQPWRGALVGWLLFIASAGTFALRLARHHYQYKTVQLTTRRPAEANTPVRRAKRAGPARAGSLKVVMSQTASSGRRTI